MLPVEFQMLWLSFDEWTPLDSLMHWHLIVHMLSGDWFAEMLRERLTEVYDRQFVDQLLPY